MPAFLRPERLEEKVERSRSSWGESICSEVLQLVSAPPQMRLLQRQTVSLQHEWPAVRRHSLICLITLNGGWPPPQNSSATGTSADAEPVSSAKRSINQSGLIRA